MGNERTESADIETAFEQQWLKVEQFLSPTWLPPERRNPMLHFMCNLREKDYHKKLRAGTSLDDFIVSRSAKHHLRPGQAFIRFMPKWEGGWDGGMEILFRNKDEEIRFRQDSTEVTPEIETLLDKLIEEPITVYLNSRLVEYSDTDLD